MPQTVIDNEKVDSSDYISNTLNDIPIENMIDSSAPSFFREYLPLICASIFILLLVSIFSTIFAFMNIDSSKIMEGVYVNGINLSGLSPDEATQKLSDTFSKKLDSTITLSYSDYKSEIIPSQGLEAGYNISAAIDVAYSVGRSNNLIKNNYEILTSLLGGMYISVNLEYNSDKLDEYVDLISVEIPGLVKQPHYYVENNNLIIEKGCSGVELLQSETKNLLISNIEKQSEINLIDLPTQNSEPEPINISNIRDEIYSEPKNAYFIQDPLEVNIGSSGVDLAISLDEAKNLLSEEKEIYTIPLKLTPPEISIADLGNEIFIHNLGTFSSNYQESNVNRTINVKLATNKINNVILLPGEEFSYNKIVGKRTYENGFREASIYTSSGVVDGLGGGICQVSSTLYNAILRANLEVVERRNHRYAVSYVSLGTDATVSYGSIDFRFKNNRNYPIKIVASSQNGVCRIDILGIKEDVEYEVVISTNKLKTIPFTTKYIDDNSMMAGTQKQTQYGDNGYKYETYKTLKLNGNIVSTEKISNDNYTPLTRVIRKGTKSN